jgi:3-isopropylmalate/(R)-2-methylmalate dehydratase small subunit
VGESFAEIFFGNCIALGVPAVTASRDDIYRLMDAVELGPDQELVLDLPSRALRFHGGTLPIEIPDWALGQLLEGTWDATRTLLTVRDDISSTAERLPYIAGF